MVIPDGRAARQLEEAGWLLDAGTVHPGQGTRNRRLAWADCYFELLWVCDIVEARANQLRVPERRPHRRSGTLRSARVTAPEPARIPEYEGPPIEQDRGPHHLELVVADGASLAISDALSVRG
jgi:hypothetical protein